MMYSNNLLTFQKSTVILKACTKKSRNLLNAPRKFCLQLMKFQNNSISNNSVLRKKNFNVNNSSISNNSILPKYPV